VSVPVTIELLSSEPAADFGESDHVVECSLSVRSGRIVVAGCADYFPEAKRIDVPSGMYRVRVSYFGLTSLSNDDRSGNDHYLLQLWPGSATDPLVLKHRGI